MDNRGCSGGTGVDIIAFPNVSEASPNNFSTAEVLPQDSANQVRVVPFKATHLSGQLKDIGRSVSPVSKTISTAGRKIEIDIQNPSEDHNLSPSDMHESQRTPIPVTKQHSGGNSQINSTMLSGTQRERKETQSSMFSVNADKSQFKQRNAMFKTASFHKKLMPQL